MTIIPHPVIPVTESVLKLPELALKKENMGLLAHLLSGFSMAFLGLVPPGMLNMTTVRMSIENGLKPAIQFAAGAASVVVVQSFIALTFAGYLSAHPELLDMLKKVAVGIFLLLALFFFFQARKKTTARGKHKKGQAFWAGMLMSSMNALAIPFYFGYSTIFEAKGWLILEHPFILFFVAGAVLGAFALFVVYARFAQVIVKRALFLATNINYILSLLFLGLAVSQIVQFF